MSLKKLSSSLMLLAALSTPTFATTLTVDGIGAGANEYATLNEALVAIAADSNDSTPDQINITTDLSPSEGVLINYTAGTETPDTTAFPPLTDPLTIDGGNNVLILPIISAFFADSGVVVTPGKDDVNFTLQNVTIIPANSGSSENAITINDVGSTNLTNIALNFDNVSLLANDGSDAPVAATQAAAAGTTLGWADDGTGAFNSGAAADGAFAHYSLTGATFTNYVVNVTNSTFAHSRFAGLVNYGDDMTMNITDTTCAFNEVGFTTNGSNGSDYTIDGLSVLNNNDAGMRVVNGGTSNVVVNSITNSVFADNGGNGLDLTDFDLDMGNITDSIFVNNGYFGIDFYGIGSTVSGTVDVVDCLFANNGGSATGEGDGSSSANVRIEFTGTAAQTDVSFSGCTFFDYVVDGSATADAHIAITWDGATDLVIDVIDSIFAGTSTETVGILNESGESAPTGAAINVSNSAVVTNGTDAITGLGDAIDGGGIINDDPQFASVGTTLPLASDAFEVNNAAYDTAATGGNQLTGWANAGSGPSNVNSWTLYK